MKHWVVGIAYDNGPPVYKHCWTEWGAHRIARRINFKHNLQGCIAAYWRES